MNRLLTPLRLLAAVTALLLGALALTAPAQAATPAKATTTQAAAPGKAWVRVAHFVPGMGAATIQLTPIDGAAQPVMTARGAGYGEVTAYQRLVPGTYTATVRKDGAASGEPLLSRSVTLVGGEARTVAVLGTADQPRLVVLQDDLTPPEPGTARVRLLSASDAAQSVSVVAKGGPTLAQDAVLGETTGYTTVPDGAWDLQLSSTGAGDVDRSVRLAGGSVYTVVALDSGSGVKLDVITDAAGAMSTPKGGADTGLGGTAVAAGAPGSTSPALNGPALASGLALSLGLLLAPVLLRRRGDVRR